MKRAYWSAIGMGAIILGSLGCGSGDKPAESAAPTPTPGKSAEAPKKSDKKSLKITLIAKSSTNPVFLSARVGAEQAAKDLTAKTGVAITIDWQTPPTEDGQVQAQKIAAAVAGGSDAILVSCSDAAKVKGAIDDAVDKGVPVMTFDSDAPDSKRFAFYGADNKDAGVQTMAELAKLKNGKANVAILAGNQNAPNLQMRVKGALEEAKKYPGIKVVGTFYHAETPQDATQEVIKDMKAHPEIDSWAMIGAWPLFATSLLTDLDPTKVIVVAVDALPIELPYVAKGIAPVLLAQPTYKWGYVSVEKIVDKVVNGKQVDAINKMELVRVSKDNLADWGKQLKDWGFEDVDKYLNLK